MKNIELKDVTKEFLEKAKPGKGEIKYEEGFNFKYSHEEKLTALWLLETFGGEIILLKQNGSYMIKNPDYKWNNKFWELKGIRSGTSLDAAIRKAIKQISLNPGGIIIDISKYKTNIKSLIGTIKNRAVFNTVKRYYIILKKKDKLIKVYKY